MIQVINMLQVLGRTTLLISIMVLISMIIHLKVFILMRTRVTGRVVVILHIKEKIQTIKMSIMVSYLMICIRKERVASKIRSTTCQVLPMRCLIACQNLTLLVLNCIMSNNSLLTSNKPCRYLMECCLNS